MLIQIPEKNDLVCFDENGSERERIIGRPEQGPVNETYNNFRHSLDDRFILWRNGTQDLDIFDSEAMKVAETIPFFWTYQGHSCLPIAAISDREVSKILALSQLNPETQILHYLEKDPQGEYEGTLSTTVASHTFPACSLL